MSSAATIELEPSIKPVDDAARYSVGTLRYTVGGLLWVFTWLLWGDFCFMVMKYVNMHVLPLRLKQLNASDWTLPIIISTVPSVINFVLNPIISTYSDRYRSRLGRRIPFLLFSTPIVSGTLVLMAFAPEIGGWLFRVAGTSGGWSNAAVPVFTLGALYAVFTTFDMFANTTFWYLFNDVVPQAFMARFMGLMRVIGSIAAMLFSYFVYAHSLTHTRWIYLGAACVYFVGFGLMCLLVREGTYPPPEPIVRKRGNVFSRTIDTIVAYGRECLTHRIYWYFFLHGMFFGLSNQITIFSTFLSLSLGITLVQLATLNTGVQFIQTVLGYPVGALADRFHPIRVMVYMKFLLLLVVPLQFIWLVADFGPQANYYILIGLTAVDLPVGLMYGAVALPLMMRLFPRENFGQFCSFNAMCGAIMEVIASMSAGLFMILMRGWFPDAIWGQDFCYRLMPVWRLPCLAVSLAFLWLLYREWQRLGGEKGYVPPVRSRATSSDPVVTVDV